MKVTLGRALHRFFIAQAQQPRNTKWRGVFQELCFALPGSFHVLKLRRESGFLDRMRSIDQHHARDLLAVEARVKAHRKSTHRMTDQHIGRSYSRGLQQCVQFAGDHFAGTRLRTELAVADSSAIIGAYTSKFRDLRLHFAPRHVSVAEPGLENDRWASFSRAVDVHLESAHVVEPAGHGIEATVAR